MRYQTDLMRSILTSETAQKMIDYVSPIYGKSYVGLWLFQAMGTVMDRVCEISEQLRYEANPATATLLLDMWEDHYKLARNPELTTEQRRNRLIANYQAKGACNPSKLAAAVSSALGGVPVEVTENVSKNKFLVTVLESVESLHPAILVIERMKPAHLIYDIYIDVRTVPTAVLKSAVAVTYGETYFVEATEPEIKSVFVEKETLVLKAPVFDVDGETLVLPADIAEGDSEVLIFK